MIDRSGAAGSSISGDVASVIPFVGTNRVHGWYCEHVSLDRDSIFTQPMRTLMAPGSPSKGISPICDMLACLYTSQLHGKVGDDFGRRMITSRMQCMLKGYGQSY